MAHPLTLLQEAHAAHRNAVNKLEKHQGLIAEGTHRMVRKGAGAAGAVSAAMIDFFLGDADPVTGIPEGTVAGIPVNATIALGGSIASLFALRHEWSHVTDAYANGFLDVEAYKLTLKILEEMKKGAEAAGA